MEVARSSCRCVRSDGQRHGVSGEAPKPTLFEEALIRSKRIQPYRKDNKAFYVFHRFSPLRTSSGNALSVRVLIIIFP